MTGQRTGAAPPHGVCHSGQWTVSAFNGAGKYHPDGPPSETQHHGFGRPRGYALLSHPFPRIRAGRDFVVRGYPGRRSVGHCRGTAEKAGTIILGIVATVQPIPGLPLLVFITPLLGIGTYPAIAALFLYSLLTIVRNTHARRTSIPADLIDFATALGLPMAARLKRIDLTLAVATVLAGIKTAAVINVGTATLGALIGAGGYGQPILTNFRLDDVCLILEGAVPAALLALMVQGGSNWRTPPGATRYAGRRQPLNSV